MTYFDDRKNVQDYIKMADGYDGEELIRALTIHLPAGSTVLELGMGPGKDLDLLSQHYKATGSDLSTVFLDLYRKTHPEADLLQLDAASLETDRLFDGIYSNKVLHHVPRKSLPHSLARQREILTPGGVLCHSFWRGDGEETHQGLLFVNYREDELTSLVRDEWEILLCRVYTEMAQDDSLLLILRRD